MADADYEQLETLFKSDIQSSDMQTKDGGSDTTVSSSFLPEWLIGVIVVVILLIIAFFAMVIYTLMKGRKRNRAGSYGGTASTTSAGETPEAGSKTDGNIRITAFSLDQQLDTDISQPANNGTNGGATWTLDSEVASTLQRRQHGPSGCRNPAFIDDDEEDSTDKANKDDKEQSDSKKQNGKVTNDSETTGKNIDDEQHDDTKTKTNSKETKKIVNGDDSEDNNKDNKVKPDSKDKEKVIHDKMGDGADVHTTDKADTESTLNGISPSTPASLTSSPKSSSGKSDSPQNGNGQVEEVEMVEHPSGERNHEGEDFDTGSTRRPSNEKRADREESETAPSVDQETDVDETDENGSGCSAEKAQQEAATATVCQQEAATAAVCQQEAATAAVCQQEAATAAVCQQEDATAAVCQQGTGGEPGVPEEAASSASDTCQKLEVVVITNGDDPSSSSSSDPQACGVTAHSDDQPETAERDKEGESSTDETEEGPGTSTNL